MDSIVAVFAVVFYVVITLIFSTALKTKHKSFWWMFFLTIPVGAIITLLLDIKDNTQPPEMR